MDLKLCGFGIPGQGFYSLQVPGLELSDQQATTGMLIVKEGASSIAKIEAEMKHLIQADWNWRVRKLTDTKYSVIFPSKALLESWSKTQGVELALHSIKAKIEKSNLDPKASSILCAAWINVSGIPNATKQSDIVKKKLLAQWERL